MHKYVWIMLTVPLLSLTLEAKVVVFWQPGFPAEASQPIDRATLDKALGALEPASELVFADEKLLTAPATLADADLFVLPYGSAVPVGSWKSIERYLDGGGN